MVLVQDPASLGQVEVVLRAHVPGDVQHPVEVSADPAVLGVLLGGPLQAVDLTLDLGPHGVGHTGLEHALAVGRNDVAATLVELLFDGLELLAEQKLTLGLLHAFGDIAADLLLQRGVGQDRLVPVDQLCQPLLDVQRLEHLELLVGAEVRRVAGHVGQVARSLGAAKELHQLRDAPRLEQALDHGAILARQLH